MYFEYSPQCYIFFAFPSIEYTMFSTTFIGYFATSPYFKMPPLSHNIFLNIQLYLYLPLYILVCMQIQIPICMYTFGLGFLFSIVIYLLKSTPIDTYNYCGFIIYSAFHMVVCVPLLFFVFYKLPWLFLYTTVL